tara:strand:- start:223 stop:627 length:405 start_codon:yes stop_codon:yes gene_type:complete
MNFIEKDVIDMAKRTFVDSMGLSEEDLLDEEFDIQTEKYIKKEIQKIINYELGIERVSPQLEDIYEMFEKRGEHEAAAYLLHQEWKKYNELKGEGFPEELWKEINDLRAKWILENDDFEKYWNELMEEYMEEKQ